MMEINKSSFGKAAALFTLKNDHGVELAVSDYGARIVSLKAPAGGTMRELVLGFASEEEYVTKDPFIGASIGRFAGRIKNGKYTIDGQAYQGDIDPQTGHSLHGGYGFDKYIWQATVSQTATEAAVTFSLSSPAGDQGFPGNLTAKVTYTLTNDNEWRLDYWAETDEATLYNPTNHVYFNLSGDPTVAIDEHQLRLASDRYIEVDANVIPTGEIKETAGTLFDFTQGQLMKEVFAAVASQASGIDGLDHPFLLTGDSPQAVLTAPDQQVAIEMTTSAPSVVIFTANFGTEGPEINGQKLADHGGITLETQIPPGVTDYPAWGSAVIKPEQPFESQTVFKIVLAQ